MLQELESRVLEVYRILDEAVAAFAAGTGLACPPGCGQCCQSEKVEATVLECIPLAFELFRSLQAELVLKRLERYVEEQRCVLYRIDYTEAGQWGCTQYRHRTLVCRLFGFAGNRGRDGIPQLAMCRVMRAQLGCDPASLPPHGSEAPMPLFVDAGLRITTLHPGFGTARLPINQALREALLKVGMFLDLTGARGDAESDDQKNPPDKPLVPCPGLGRRAA